MFKLITVEDTIVIPARFFAYPKTKTIEHVINKNMSDRVIPGIGLVIALWDILRAGDDKLARHSGNSTTECQFRLLVFAPFVGEVIPARVGPSTEAGILAYLRFFNLVWIPYSALPKPCSFDETDKVWSWNPPITAGEEAEGEGASEVNSTTGEIGEPGTDAEAEGVHNYMDGGNETMVRVTAVDYDENSANTTSSNSTATTTGSSVRQGGGYSMVIKASMYDEVTDDNQGLGDPAWWYEGDEEEPTEENADAAQEGGEYGEGYEEAEGDYAEGDGEQWEGGEEEVTDELVHEEGGEAAVDAEEAEE